MNPTGELQDSFEEDVRVPLGGLFTQTAVILSGAEIPYLTDTQIEWSLDGAPLGATRGGSKKVEAPGTGGAESRWIRGDT